MPSNLVFTSVTGGVQVTGTFGTGIASVDLPHGDYQLMQMNATQLWLKPLNGGYDIKPFALADVATPAAGSLAALKTALRALLSNSSDMTPYSIIWVSGIHGNDSTGNGAIDAPYATITKGIQVADGNATIDGTPWEVRALGGGYDETVASIGNDVYLRLCTGAVLSCTTGPCVSDSGGSVYLHVEAGAEVYAANAGSDPEISVTSYVVKVAGDGRLYISDIAGIDVSGGEFWATGIRIEGDSNSGALINQSGGEVRLISAQAKQPFAASAIVKSGGTMLLTGSQIETVHTDYASAPAAQDIQIVDCACNVVAGANINEVGTMLVNAAFVI